jgi:phytoene dehydrogenase-like protein
VSGADAVVVGAGPNGLSAAIALARGGRSVLVLEAQEALGGAVRTEELTLRGFHHDVFSAVHPAAAASPVFERIGLERFGLRWIHPPVAMAHPLEDGTGAALLRDVGDTAATLEALAPGDGRRYEGFVAPYVRRFAALRATMLAGFPPVLGPARLVAGLRLRHSLDFARLMLMSARTLTAQLFDSEGSRAWLYGSAMHGDVQPQNSGSAISGIYLQVLGHGVGWPSPEGGAGRLAGALVRALEASGGRWRTGARVERLLVRAGRVAGVRVSGGDVVEAPIVLLDTTPKGLLALAGDALPGAYARRLVHYRYGAPTFKVDWALDGPAPWQHEHARHAGTVHVGGTAGEVVRALGQAETGTIPDRPFLLFGQQSLADPTRAPEGGHTAWAYTHVPHRVEWAGERESFADRMEEQVERFAPGFRDRILARHIMDPNDLEHRNENLVEGDVGAGSYSLDQLVFRPVPSLSPYRTPVRGLYLGSASTFPGGAVHGVPGWSAARAALMDARLRRV